MLNMEKNFILVALSIFVFLSLFYVVSAEDNNQTEFPVSCSKVTGLENFETVTDDETNVIRVLYRGVHNECLMNWNNTLRLEFEKIVRITSIEMVIIVESRYRLSYSRLSLDNLVFSAVRDISSEQTVSYENCQFESYGKDSNDGKFELVFLCMLPLIQSTGTLANAVEMKPKEKAAFLFKLQNLTWKLRFEPMGNHKEHCLTPGKYPTQTLKNPQELYTLSHTATYCHGNESSCETTRTCTKNGWTGSPERPLLPSFTNYSTKEQTVLMAQNETIFLFNQDLLNISAIFVAINLPCEKTCQDEFLSKVSVAIGKIFKAANYWARKSLEARAEGCLLAFVNSRKKTEDCLDCAVKVTLADDLLKSNVNEVTVLGWNNDSYDWMKNGCPPIDPYVGMPDEYADDASRDRHKLNRYLKSKPCSDGYRFVSNMKNPRQCIESSWIGDIPQCALITCRRPPKIDHGKWYYAHRSVYHQVQYTCGTPFFLSNGNGTATCNYERNKWENVPYCVKSSEEGCLQEGKVVVLASVLGCVLLLNLIYTIGLLVIRIRKAINTKGIETVYTHSISINKEDYYINAITREQLREASVDMSSANYYSYPVIRKPIPPCNRKAWSPSEGDQHIYCEITSGKTPDSQIVTVQ